MKKKTLENIKIIEVLASYQRMPLSDFINYLKEICDSYSEKGYINLSIENENSYDTYGVFIYGDRLETDEEYAKRIKIQQKNKERRKEKLAQKNSKLLDTLQAEAEKLGYTLTKNNE